MADQKAPYRKLLKRCREISLLSGTSELLSWDQETYMPPKALSFRAEELAHLGGLAHRLFTSRKVGDWISACEQLALPSDSEEGANVREWRRRYDRATKIPTRLVERFQKVCAHGREAWRVARERSNFRPFKPHLQKLLDLSRQMADCWGYEETPYDALLEEYEPGVRTRQLRELFDELRPALTSILGPAIDRSSTTAKDLLLGHYPIPAQQAFNRRLAEAIGFDLEAGRIDTTTHPFCSGLGPGDCRLTTRYNEQDFTQSLYGILHETGHGLYEQGLPAQHHGTPLGSAASLGIHESQSRLWENHVGRGAAFWDHWHPVACEFFPDLSRFTPAQISDAVNRVSPSFIRVEADQVTYDLHIMLRFAIEVKLIDRQLAVADVPAYWNEEFEKLFGLKVPNDAQGCLQDIHWSMGAFGYFPTYTLGNLNASQLMNRALQAIPSLENELSRGQYAHLLAWLRENVHRHGLRYTPPELMRRATGEPTRAASHLDYLRKKFAGAMLP